VSVQHDFTGRVVLVTGGARGIGRATATAFLDAGAEVVVCGRSTPESLPEAGGRSAGFVAADVRDPEQVRALVAELVSRHGRLDVAINNAGGSPPTEAATAPHRFSERIIALNLLGPLAVAQAANAVMQDQDDGGVILMIGSVSGIRPSPGTAVYGAAKAGLHHLAGSLAIEWAPKVRVATVAAGLVRTDLADEHYGGPQYVDAIERTIPMQRMAAPEEVAAACLWLAGPAAAYVTGTMLVLHGGDEWPSWLSGAPPAAYPPAAPWKRP
jgi:NAD(P)-dependent dehydrogenase (short-subunit alcohol dehydrogenase family)